MMNELKVLETTVHPNIVRLYELLNDDEFYYIVSEYLKYGELYDFIVKQGHISEPQVQKIVKQLFLAINYMHTNNMVHRDIKPENILIDSVTDVYIKLTDFGFASFYEAQGMMDDMLGSPMYMPPEIVKH